MEHNVNEPCDKEKGLKGGKPDVLHIQLLGWTLKVRFGDSAHELDNGPKGSKESSFSGE